VSPGAVFYNVSRDKAAPDESGSRVEGSRELLDIELPAVVPASGVFADAKDGLERAHQSLSARKVHRSLGVSGTCQG